MPTTCGSDAAPNQSTPSEEVGAEMRAYIVATYGRQPTVDEFSQVYWCWEEECERVMENTGSRSERTVRLAKPALSRLAWLCDGRVAFLQKCLKENEENFGNDMDADEISDAENDITYFEGLAAQLRSARNG